MADVEPIDLTGLNLLAGHIARSTKDILVLLAILLLSDLLGVETDKIKADNPILKEFIRTDCTLAQLSTLLGQQGDLSALLETVGVGISTLGTIASQPQLKQLATVFREQFNGPEKHAVDLVQRKLEVSKALSELITVQRERIVNALDRTINNKAPDDKATHRELMNLNESLKVLSIKINQLVDNQSSTKIELLNLGAQVISNIPATVKIENKIPATKEALGKLTQGTETTQVIKPVG